MTGTGKKGIRIIRSKNLRMSFNWAPIVHGLVRSSSCIRAIPITCRTKELRRGKGEMRSKTRQFAEPVWPVWVWTVRKEAVNRNYSISESQDAR